MTISEDVFAMLLIHIERGWQRQDLVTQNEREIEDFEIYLSKDDDTNEQIQFIPIPNSW